MKDAWKEDEQEKDFYYKETIRLKNEAISAEKELRNEHEIEITELCRKIKAIKMANPAKDEAEYKRLQQTYKSVVKENLKLTTGRFQKFFQNFFKIFLNHYSNKIQPTITIR